MPQDLTPVLEYARHLVALHKLDMQGKNESAEADSVRDEMDAPWYAMTTQEQERMGGLSADLYALAEGGPPSVAMNEQQIKTWKTEAEDCKKQYLNGDIDAWLAFCRKPRPNSFPPPCGNPTSVVHFLQARCWDKFGDYETAAIFMQAAEKTDPQLAGLVLDLFHHAGNRDEERRYANRILNDSMSKPVFIYVAACYLFGQFNRMKSQRESLCNRLIPILKEAIKREQLTPHGERDLPDTEMNLLKSLGFCFELVGKDNEAMMLYDQALELHPNDPDLWLNRGIVLLYFRNDLAGYIDLQKAIQYKSNRCLPFLVLATKEFQANRFGESFQLARTASEKEGTNELVSLAHQLIAISLSMRDQNIEWVLDNFKLAEKLDPGNSTIAHNRAVAIARAEKQTHIEPWIVEKKPQIINIATAQPSRLSDQVLQHMEQVMSVA